MFKKLTVTLVATILFTSLVSAQSVHLRGKIEDSGATFVIKCTDISVSSSAFNLNLFNGMQVEADGIYNGSTAAPSIELTSIQQAPETFSIGGGASIGGRADFVARANPGDRTILALSLGSGVTLLGPSVLMLDPSTTLVLGIAIADGNGEGKISVPIPVNQALVGLEIFGQAAIIPSAGGPRYLSNPDCKTISN